MNYNDVLSKIKYFLEKDDFELDGEYVSIKKLNEIVKKRVLDVLDLDKLKDSINLELEIDNKKMVKKIIVIKLII